MHAYLQNIPGLNYSDFELKLVYDNGQFVTSVNSYKYLITRISRETHDYNYLLLKKYILLKHTHLQIGLKFKNYFRTKF